MTMSAARSGWSKIEFQLFSYMSRRGAKHDYPTIGQIRPSSSRGHPDQSNNSHKNRTSARVSKSGYIDVLLQYFKHQRTYTPMKAPPPPTVQNTAKLVDPTRQPAERQTTGLALSITIIIHFVLASSVCTTTFTHMDDIYVCNANIYRIASTNILWGSICVVNAFAVVHPQYISHTGRTKHMKC